MIPNNVWLCCTVASPEARIFPQIRIIIITTMIKRIRVTVLLITITTTIAMNLRQPQQLFNGTNRAGASIWDRLSRRGHLEGMEETLVYLFPISTNGCLQKNRVVLLPVISMSPNTSISISINQSTLPVINSFR